MYGRTLRGLLRPPPATVKARVARASYGISCNSDWEIGVHSAQDMIWSKHLLCYLAQNQADWFIKEVLIAVPICVHLIQWLTIL